MQRLPEGTLAPDCPYQIMRVYFSDLHLYLLMLEFYDGRVSLRIDSEILTRHRLFAFLEDIQSLNLGELQLTDDKVLIYDGDHPGWITYRSLVPTTRPVEIEFCQELLDALDELAR